MRRPGVALRGEGIRRPDRRVPVAQDRGVRDPLCAEPTRRSSRRRTAGRSTRPRRTAEPPVGSPSRCTSSSRHCSPAAPAMGEFAAIASSSARSSSSIPVRSPSEALRHADRVEGMGLHLEIAEAAPPCASASCASRSASAGSPRRRVLGRSSQAPVPSSATARRPRAPRPAAHGRPHRRPCPHATTSRASASSASAAVGGRPAASTASRADSSAATPARRQRGRARWRSRTGRPVARLVLRPEAKSLLVVACRRWIRIDRRGPIARCPERKARRALEGHRVQPGGAGELEGGPPVGREQFGVVLRPPEARDPLCHARDASGHARLAGSGRRRRPEGACG